MAKFILETNYPSRRIIRLSINPKTNFDEYFVYIYVTRYACDTTGVLVLSRVEAWHPRKPCENIETTPSHVETPSKNRLRFRLYINLETDHPSKTIYPSVS